MDFQGADHDVFKGTISAFSCIHMKCQSRWQIHLLDIIQLHSDSGPVMKPGDIEDFPVSRMLQFAQCEGLLNA